MKPLAAALGLVALAPAAIAFAHHG